MSSLAFESLILLFFFFSLYLLFPRSAPDSETDSARLADLRGHLPQIAGGEGRTLGTQALMQLVALGATVGLAIVTGLLTGTSEWKRIFFLTSLEARPQHLTGLISL